MSEINTMNIIDIVPKKRGRPCKLKKDIDDPDYFNRYYREHLAQKIICPLCSISVSKAKMKRHQKTIICAIKQKNNIV